MMRHHALRLCIPLLLLLATGPAAARGEEASAPQVSDLTLANFFEGWDQAWTHRHRSTPDMALLRVTTNFLEREFRLDFVANDVANSPKLSETYLLNGLIAYGLSRRLMIELISNYQWNEAFVASSSSQGPGVGALVRVQLVDTPDKSYAVQARFSPPNRGIGQTQSSATFAAAGWQDLHALVPALDRVGLYYSVQYENLPGPRAAGAPRNDLSYDLSLAKTWTDPATPGFRNFTTFVEGYATTYLDGASAGKTVFSVTPGIRFWFVPENSITLGGDVPVSHDAPSHAVYRATYILNF